MVSALENVNSATNHHFNVSNIKHTKIAVVTIVVPEAEMWYIY